MRLFKALHSIRLKSSGFNDAIAYVHSLDLAAPRQSQNSAAPPYYSFKLFAKAAARCVSEALTKNSNQHTIQIEAAGALGGSSRQFDWPNKICVQLSVQEMYTLVATCESLVVSAEFKGHGLRNDKALFVELQSGTIYFKMVQLHRKPLGIPVRAIDAMPLVNLLYRQILKNEPHLTADQIRTNLATLAKML
jgi:hypothetical protein